MHGSLNVKSCEQVQSSYSIPKLEGKIRIILWLQLLCCWDWGKH